jgi:hypothetical protein
MSHDQKALYKLGTLDERGSDVEFRYGNLYDIEKTTGGSRLVIAPADGHDVLLGDLVELVDGPYHLLYVLLVSRLGRDEGRYQSPEQLSLADVCLFLKEHGHFLARDGRHHFWIGAADRSGLLVYDQHNVIYAYGPLAAFEGLLRRKGFHREEVRFPGPHTHHYHPENDAAEDRLFAAWEWIQFPLEEQDEWS